MSARVTVPAENVDDFRAAIVEELSTTIGHVHLEQKHLAQETERQDTKAAETTAVDLSAAMRFVAADARLLVDAGHEGDEEIHVDVDEDGTLAHAFETMARNVIGPRVAAMLEYGPMEARSAADLCELLDRLSWAIRRAAECHEGRAPARKGSTV